MTRAARQCARAYRASEGGPERRCRLALGHEGPCRKVSDKTHERQLGLPPSERALYGATVTLRNQRTRAVRSEAYTQMTALQGVALAVAACKALGPEWLIVSISTPQTIYRDAYASRLPVGGGAQLDRPSSTPHRPELDYLTRCRVPGAAALLEPWVYGASVPERQAGRTRAVREKRPR